MQTSIIVLAAGSSSRLGQPKQLLSYQGKSLLCHIIETALTVVSDVKVVLGANEPLLTEHLQQHVYPISIISNPDWQEGMASSIRAGMAHVSATTDAVLFVLSDQPAVSVELLASILVQAQTNNQGIVACEYAQQQGVPMLFKRPYFALLQKLQGEKGAKSVLAQHQYDSLTVPFAQGNWDIDTPNDLKSLV